VGAAGGILAAGKSARGSWKVHWPGARTAYETEDFRPKDDGATSTAKNCAEPEEMLSPGGTKNRAREPLPNHELRQQGGRRQVNYGTLCGCFHEDDSARGSPDD